MTEKSIKISIILPTYNRLYSLQNIFLPSLAKQDFTRYELIVVDDNSSDGTAEYFAHQFKKDFPRVAKKTKYFRNQKNLGAPASRNVGVKKASAEWVYIVEDDIYIESEKYLQDASEAIDELDMTVAVLSPRRFDIKGDGYYKNPRRSFARLGWSGEVYIDNSQKYTGFVPTTHASSFIERAVYLQVQEDEKLFYGNTFRDETDLYAGIVKLGYKIYYMGDKLQTIHRNDFAISGGQKKVAATNIFGQEFMLWKNHYRYLKKHYSVVPARIVVFVIVRVIKRFANLTKLTFIKNWLSLCRV